mgnify:FL=1
MKSANYETLKQVQGDNIAVTAYSPWLEEKSKGVIDFFNILR